MKTTKTVMRAAQASRENVILVSQKTPKIVSQVPQKTPKTASQVLLEQLKTAQIGDKTVVLTRVANLASAWCSRSVLRAVQVRRKRQLAEIKRDCRRLRGLLRDLD